jgi:hypothetical protein
MTESDLPIEASEADVMEQQAELSDSPGEPFGSTLEAEPADVAEQARSVPLDDEDGYPQGE